ncbi:MAG: hypothetical protein ACXWNK_14890 [Vulcanimicrobiaceae bacterium]
MIAAFDSTDSRLLARVIHLAHRFGCTYTRAEAQQDGGSYRVQLHFTGPGDALVRLSKQIDKLTTQDKETL